MVFLHARGAGYLEVGEALALGTAQQRGRHVVEAAVSAKLPVRVVDLLQLLEEPAVYLRQLMYAVDGEAVVECFLYHEDAFVGRGVQRAVHVIDLYLLVVGEAVHSLADHAESFLYGLLEGASYGHHLAHRLHARLQLAVHSPELAEVPARYLADHVVERGLEEGRGRFGHGVLQVEESVAQSELGRHEGERIARGLGGEGRRTAQAGVHLDHAVVLAFGAEGELHVAFADDADVARDADAQLAQLVVFAVGERLRRSHHDALAGMDAQWVEVLHVADGDAVVETVAHHLVFHLFPALEALLHEYLRREGESLGGEGAELVGVVAEAGAETSERVGRAQDHGVSQTFGGGKGFLCVGAGLAVDGLHVDLVKLAHEDLPVLRVDDRLHGRAEHTYAVFLEHPRFIQLHPAVEGRLAAEGQHDAVRMLPLDHALHKKGSHRQEIYMVGNSLTGLHSGYVGVYQNGLDPLFPKGLQCLASGIVELSGLADLEGSRSEHQHFLYVVSVLHVFFTGIRDS